MFMIFVETDPDDQTDVDNEVFTAALKEMVSLGIDITRIIHQQVVAQSIDSPHNPIPEATSLAFERVTRAVRRSIMLAKKLREPPKPPRASSPLSLGEKVGVRVEPSDRTSSDNDPRERPDRPDQLETLEDRPTIDLINEIRRDLNLPPMTDRSVQCALALHQPKNPTPNQIAQCASALHQPIDQCMTPTHDPPHRDSS